ncbi:MAG TPA: hypothetical protein VGI70_04055 [Polyangiales bacterium]|jgi:ligand-binding SRPBCC domain-containing protein
MAQSNSQVIRISSSLRAPAASVWRHAATLEGINEELWPIHMSGPPRTQLTSDAARGEPLFRSVVSLLRVIVLDLHEIKLLRVDENEGFHESSRSLLERRWEHIRTITPQPGGCVISDEVQFEPRVLRSLLTPVVRLTFERRHALLRRKFGELVVRN